MTATATDLRALWYEAEARAVAAEGEIRLLRSILRAIVDDTADPSTGELRCWPYPVVTSDQDAAVRRALAAT